MELTQKQIGERIIELRKSKGWSQEELAKRIGMSRPSLVQLELGNRSLGAQELQKISFVFEFSLDEFFSPVFKLTDALEEEKTSPAKEEIRISVPTLNVEKFKNILLYILERCAGKPNVGETVLYKLLYFADFNYYEIYEEHLTGAKYKKLPFGPVPQKLDTVLNRMIEEGKLQRIKTEYHGYPQTRFLPLEKPDLTLLKASETEVIDRVLDQMSDWSAAKISDYSHKDLPWEVTDEGKEIAYNLAFYRELPHSVRVYNESENE